MEIFYDDEVEQSLENWADTYYDEDCECDIEIYGVRDAVRDQDDGTEFDYIYFNFKAVDKELSKEEKYAVEEYLKDYINDMNADDFNLRFQGAVDIEEYTNGLYC